MKQRIGVVGATGNLGEQLTARLRQHGLDVITCTKTQKNSPTVNDLLNQCEIVHICAPVQALEGAGQGRAIAVLHDSVMATSKEASERYLNGSAAIVHMLMNEANTVVAAADAPHHQEITAHLLAIGLKPHAMTIAEHDSLMARSQAPLALLCKTLLPFLYEQDKEGLLTPSGQLLATTLQARELAWTDETVRSILQNPQLPRLIKDMQAALTQQTGLRVPNKHAISKES